MTAGIETLKLLNQPGVYNQLENKAANLEEGIGKAAAKAGISMYISRIASLLTVFFTADSVADYESAKQADTKLFNKFFHGLLADGIYWPPSQFEAVFVSFVHSDEDIKFTISAAIKALDYLKQ